MLLPNRLLYELPLPYNYGTRCYTGMQYRRSLLYELPLPYNYGTRCYTGMQYRRSLLYELPLPYNYGTRCYTGMQYRRSLLYELPLPYNNMTGATESGVAYFRSWFSRRPRPLGCDLGPATIELTTRNAAAAGWLRDGCGMAAGPGGSRMRDGRRSNRQPWHEPWEQGVWYRVFGRWA